MKIITDSASLASLCDTLRSDEYITVDTEFLRESTYYPLLCLIQVARPRPEEGAPEEEDGFIIDPLADGLDLAPFWALMADTNVLKVFHAARQDVEIVWNMGGVIPEPLFDTQVAASVCGYGESIGYEAIVRQIAKAEIDKSSRFTDWSRRPLSKKQLDYAISDVTHLRTVFETLYDKLDEQDRHEWVGDEMRVLTSPETYIARPEDAWKRIKSRVRKPQDMAILQSVAAWRETEAQTRDVPRSRVLKDDAIGEIAMQKPKDSNALGQLRAIPNGFERSRHAKGLMEAIRDGMARDTSEIDMPDKPRQSNGGASATVELFKVLLRMVADRERVAPRIIASGEELERLASEDEPDLDVLKGWRRDLFGEPARMLRDGKVAMTIEEGRAVLVSRDEDAATVFGAKKAGRPKRRRRSGSRDPVASPHGEGETPPAPSSEL